MLCQTCSRFIGLRLLLPRFRPCGRPQCNRKLQVACQFFNVRCSTMAMFVTQVEPPTQSCTSPVMAKDEVVKPWLAFGDRSHTLSGVPVAFWHLRGTSTIFLRPFFEFESLGSLSCRMVLQERAEQLVSALQFSSQSFDGGSKQDG